MNINHLTKLAAKMKLKDEQKQACLLVLGGMSSRRAEVEIYGQVTNTINRLWKKVIAEYEFSSDLIANTYPISTDDKLVIGFVTKAVKSGIDTARAMDGKSGVMTDSDIGITVEIKSPN